MLNSQQIAFAKVLNLVEESECMPYVCSLDLGQNSLIEKPAFSETSRRV